MPEETLECRDVSASDSPARVSGMTVGLRRSSSGHPVPIADAATFIHPRISPGMSPSSSRKEQSIKNLLKQPRGGSRERSASWSHYPTPFSSPGTMPPLSPFLPYQSPISSNNKSPFMPSLCPPMPSMSKSAMDAAMASERKRMKEMELEEEGKSAEELKSILRRERVRMSRMAADLAVLKSNVVQSQAEAEVNEEGRINCLLAHLDTLQQEKGRIIVELEREEEMLTNTLQKKLNEVKREKEMLEQYIEREQHAHNEMKAIHSKRKPLPPVVDDQVDEGTDEASTELELDDLAAVHEAKESN